MSEPGGVLDGDGEGEGGDEFAREPVPERARLGLRSFLGMYAGEHVAGTELMIGPLFVASGIAARDLVLGLLLGNALAVLSWVLLTAPIATRARLTLYYQLERICGRRLVTLYNLANGVMFCFLAGAMITVAATAVGVLVEFPMPALTDTVPNSVGWVVAVVLVGALISVVASRGYRVVARFSAIAAPWMIALFVCFGVIGLYQLGVRDLDGLVDAAETVIWKGGEPLPGQQKLGFWHVVMFAWFCNMAMHVGMSDLSVLRFARRSWYSVSSAAGMFLGHFVAWLCASILFAVQLDQDPGNDKVLPGPMAYATCGIAGLICVVVAGWTTANPTIYRAGLAFQAVLPQLPRARVTLVTGGLATLAGVFPAIAMQLLDFVALYGLVLMPMGAVIFADFWLLPKLGMRRDFAAAAGRSLHWGAALSWGATLLLCLGAVQLGGVDLFFVSLPGWFVACVLYLVASRVIQRRARLVGSPA